MNTVLHTLKKGMDEAFFLEQVTEQARIELALEKFLRQQNAMAFSTNFQDLHGMKQLPGLAVQRLMGKGYGFAGEGDWKIAALVRILKRMGEGLEGGTSFMEDYTYHLERGNMLDLGAHMLEVCPSIAAERPSLEVHPLGIGDREDPARLVFDGATGAALCASIIDLGHRFRMVISEVETVASPHTFTQLPVARVLWKPLPTSRPARPGFGRRRAPHAYSSALDSDYLLTFAEMMGIEAIRIDKAAGPNSATSYGGTRRTGPPCPDLMHPMDQARESLVLFFTAADASFRLHPIVSFWSLWPSCSHPTRNKSQRSPFHHLTRG